MQIIAAAGSGKTEVVSQRVANLLAVGEAPRSIVAFTFTSKAATELKERISQRVESRLGEGAVDKLSGLYVGTIHSYCFQILQQYVPRYETYDVLDDNQLTAFLSREAKRLEIRQLDDRNRLYASIRRFRQSIDVIENELLDPASMPEPFRSVLLDYLDTLERYRLLTFGQQIARTVQELLRPDVRAHVHADLRHLIVDEYQDVNPAQERLIELLAGPQVELCVVGDDDQAIYQWRGSDVGNIVSFADRYPGAATFEIATNRRSRPDIVATANRFAQTIPGRLDKDMETHRPGVGSAPQVVLWDAEDELTEAGCIAESILRLNDVGVPFRDIAVLVRGKAAYPTLLSELHTFGIPVQPGGRSGLFEQPEARALGQVLCWMTDVDWRNGYTDTEQLTDESVLDTVLASFGTADALRSEVRAALRGWKRLARQEQKPADLLHELYELLDVLRVRDWDIEDPLQANRLGTLARFSALLADYESVKRRARPDVNAPGEQVGGQDRGLWYYRSLALHIINYATGAFEGFDGETDLNLDAIELTTVHRAKGLEWPVVFVPSLTKSRFPSSQTGRAGDWLVPRADFAAARYEGSDGDERRLFYVALTRARDLALVSRHERVTSRRVGPSPYFEELQDLQVDWDDIQYPEIETRDAGNHDHVAISFSELAQFLECGRAYRLRSLLGFEPRLAPELGYGQAVHHVLRTVAEETRMTGVVPDEDGVDRILHDDFFLPAANKPAHKQMKAAARRLVNHYVTNHQDDLFRIWETERPFELHLDGVTVSGRADVILDKEGGVETSLAILDYKTSKAPQQSNHLQLQVYVDAGRREGLDVPAAYIHNLGAMNGDPARTSVDVAPTDLAAAESVVLRVGEKLRRRDFSAQPERTKCQRCDVRAVCGSAA